MERIELLETVDTLVVFGKLDENLNAISKAFGVDVLNRDNYLEIVGDNEKLASHAINEIITIANNKKEEINLQKVNYIIELVKRGESYVKSNIDSDIITYTFMGKPIKAKTIGQKYYIKSMRKKDIVFGIGPAGTGKTYLAVAMAISAYKNKLVQKIILARPAVEAGESLGFLPGDLQDKVDPYLRPLYDALYEMLGRDNATKLREKEVIEIVPLAYMRGRTLDNAFIILDEAQNTTKEQMKMFLTRMGFGSKMVITGDVTQIDLPRGKKSGLKDALKILKEVEDIDFCYLKDIDVVRHDLVKKIISAYDKHSSEEELNNK
ncbi:MAG: PhoH family protein [Eubacteriales bacterium]|nr:PhoH family protein [Eubacteriales bacterium]MDY3332978.1 PhoH family protein [Gallibacter sp.]